MVGVGWGGVGCGWDRGVVVWEWFGSGCWGGGGVGGVWGVVWWVGWGWGRGVRWGKGMFG